MATNLRDEALAVEAYGKDQPEEWLRGALGLGQGETPFPWQVDMLQRFRRGETITALDIPTGLGKTATMAVWLVARALGASVPRKLVYVVDRRAVVDQATEVAESLRAWVTKEREVASALALRDRALPISTLRGQYIDNREWLEDPSTPAIIIGTIDMVGSRLLFSGYGVSSKMRPYHAGLLAADTLLVLDEAHLVPAFEYLLQQIASGSGALGPKGEAERKLIPPFKLLSLSATGRRTDSTTLTLSDSDRRHPVVAKRLTAKKALTTVELAAVAQAADVDGTRDSESDETEDDTNSKGKGPTLARALARQAWDLTQQGSDGKRCIVFCNARKDATAVAAELRTLARAVKAPDPTIELFIGGRRVRERVEAREALARLGFLARTSVNRERSAFLIATSAGEVGVDLDADAMVCDLVGWERMVQRLGRVNRRGDGDARVIVVIESEPAPPTKKAKESLREKLTKRAAAREASKDLIELRKKLSELQGGKEAAPRGRNKSDEAQAAEEKRKKAEMELRKAISACQKRSKSFTDADAKVVARHDAEVAKYRALRKLLEVVREEGGRLSPDALLQLRRRQDLDDALRDAMTAEPLRPELTRALVDAWSMTSLDVHPGRPEVDPWLRGFSPNDPPQTTLVWRRHLPVRHDGSFDAKATKRFFEAAPPHTSEQLETETHLVLEWLTERATAASKTQGEQESLGPDQIVAIALTPSGDVKAHLNLRRFAAAKSKGKKQNKDVGNDRGQNAEPLEQLLAGSILVIDARLGGLTDGLLDERAKSAVDAADDSSTTWLIRGDVDNVPVTGFRVRVLSNSEQDGADTDWRATAGDGWVCRHLFVTEMVDGEPKTALAVDGWIGDAATEDERAEADRPQPLDEHQSWAEECARSIAARLGLDKKYENLLALAARLHDEGKRAARWQRAFRAPVHGRPYAKTKGPIDFDILDGYRHELGSLPSIEAHPEFLDLPPDDQDLVLHLVAAHHGYARPVTGTSGCDDAPPSTVDERAREVALRFARLSRRWGPWGLAWWEVLLRAADQAASRRNQPGDASAARRGRT